MWGSGAEPATSPRHACARHGEGMLTRCPCEPCVHGSLRSSALRLAALAHIGALEVVTLIIASLQTRTPGLVRLWSHSRNTVGLDKPTVFRAHRSGRAQHSDNHERSSGNSQKWGVTVGALMPASAVGVWVISLSSALLSPTARRGMGSIPFLLPSLAH